MIRLCILVTCAALLSSGCTNEAADLGTPSPVALATNAREIVVPLSASRAPKERNRQLEQSVDAIANGDRQAVRARIMATSGGEAEALRGTLIALGLDPARITVAAGRKPRRSPVVVLARTASRPADCRAAVTLAYPNDPLPSLMSLAHCQQADDLAGMLVDPADLLAPPSLAHADGAYLTDGVRSWRASRVDALPATGTSGSSEPASAGSSSAPSASTAGLGNVVPTAGTTVVAPAATPTGTAATP